MKLKPYNDQEERPSHKFNSLKKKEKAEACKVELKNKFIALPDYQGNSRRTVALINHSLQPIRARVISNLYYKVYR